MSATWNGEAAKAITRRAAAEGLNAAAEYLRAKAVPKTPALSLDLTRSLQIHETNESELASQVQADTPYAVIQHEAVEFSHTTDPHPEAQAKYIEGPLRESEKELSAIVARRIGGAL